MTWPWRFIFTRINFNPISTIIQHHSPSVYYQCGQYNSHNYDVSNKLLLKVTTGKALWLPRDESDRIALHKFPSKKRTADFTFIMPFAHHRHLNSTMLPAPGNKRIQSGSTSWLPRKDTRISTIACILRGRSSVLRLVPRKAVHACTLHFRTATNDHLFARLDNRLVTMHIQ